MFLHPTCVTDWRANLLPVWPLDVVLTPDTSSRRMLGVLVLVPPKVVDICLLWVAYLFVWRSSSTRDFGRVSRCWRVRRRLMWVLHHTSHPKRREEVVYCAKRSGTRKWSVSSLSEDG